MKLDELIRRLTVIREKIGESAGSFDVEFADEDGDSTFDIDGVELELSVLDSTDESFDGTVKLSGNSK